MIIHGDSLVELKKLEDNSVDSIVTDPPYGISFMGKKWDYDVPSVELWKEILRVLKPGGHALVACGTRTQHRMAVNLEDAGFEIRDIVAWVYGSGFPKSLNIGKAVDKLQGNEREVISEQQRKGRSAGILGKETEITHIHDKGNSPYEGWGTALKPSMELWTLCRKPLEEKTVAENVLKYGCGGLNIDGCRVKGESWGTRTNSPESKQVYGDYGFIETEANNLGRFPANLIHDDSDEVVELFPDSNSPAKRQTNSWFPSGEANGVNGESEGYGDSGSASRFFYCAKASRSERNKGLQEFEEKERTDYGGFHSEKGLIENGRNPENRQPMKNGHPTVKPIKLMQYLCRLITPKGGTVLDPFMGSGSTGIGAKLEGFNFIGIEREEDYCKIAEARINAYDL